MDKAVTIENGFAKVGAGAWLTGRAQPVAYSGRAIRRRRKGWLLRDRSWLELVETSGSARCASAVRPFVTHIPCAAPISAVSAKVLVAPSGARTGAQLVKTIPMSLARSLCVTEFGSEWVVMATRGRTARIQVPEGETLSVRPDAVVAWSGAKPTGFCPKLGVLDMLLPRGPRELMLTFYGPSLVWVEGAGNAETGFGKCRRAYGV